MPPLGEVLIIGNPKGKLQPVKQHVAFVSDRGVVAFAELKRVATAIEKHVVKHFAPFWKATATVRAYASLDGVPDGSWIVRIRSKTSVSDAVGFHILRRGIPTAEVSTTGDWAWSQIASHEVLEMLADPLNNQTVRAPAVGKRTVALVEYPMQVCDPCSGIHDACIVDGVRLADFVTREYFDPAAAPDVRFSFSRRITAPFQILRGGYLQWLDRHTGQWKVLSGPFRGWGRDHLSRRLIDLLKATGPPRQRKDPLPESVTATQLENAQKNAIRISAEWREAVLALFRRHSPQR